MVACALNFEKKTLTVTCIIVMVVILQIHWTGIEREIIIIMAGMCPLQSYYSQLHHHRMRLRLRFPFPPPHQSSGCKLKGWIRSRSRSRSITTLFNLSCSNNLIIINSHNAGGSQGEPAGAGAGRREVLLQGVFAAGYGCLSSSSLPTPYNSLLALAADDTDPMQEDAAFRVYSDDVNKFKILIPRDWQVGSGGEGNGIRSLTAFYPQETSNSNVSIVITGLGADFTRLESFGKVDAFAENLVSGLDRSWQRPPGVTAKLIDSKAANGLYYIEYTLQNPGESRRHLYSVLGIANNGWYNRLYTLTGQFVEEEADKYGSTIKKAVASFRLI